MCGGFLSLPRQTVKRILGRHEDGDQVVNLSLTKEEVMALQTDPGASTLLYEVRLEKNVLIPTRDGTCLAADLHWPVGEGPFPVVLEYIPYRKDDNTVPSHGLHYYFAQRGYVGVRLDVRGTGASEGINTDEYML